MRSLAKGMARREERGWLLQLWGRFRTAGQRGKITESEESLWVSRSSESTGGDTLNRQKIAKEGEVGRQERGERV